MAERVNVFGVTNESNLVQMAAKLPKEKKNVDMPAINQIAEEYEFLSREPQQRRKPSLRRKVRVNATGRNQLITIRLTNAVKERFYKQADDRCVALCELLELALDALEKKSS